MIQLPAFRRAGGGASVREQTRVPTVHAWIPTVRSRTLTHGNTGGHVWGAGLQLLGLGQCGLGQTKNQSGGGIHA